MVKNMKKILVGIFVVLFSLPAMAGSIDTCALVEFKVQYDIAETERLPGNEIEFVPVYCPGNGDCIPVSLTSGEDTLSKTYLDTDADKAPISLQRKGDGFRRYFLPGYSYDPSGLDFSKIKINGEARNTFYRSPLSHQLVARYVELNLNNCVESADSGLDTCTFTYQVEGDNAVYTGTASTDLIEHLTVKDVDYASCAKVSGIVLKSKLYPVRMDPAKVFESWNHAGEPCSQDIVDAWSNGDFLEFYGVSRTATWTDALRDAMGRYKTKCQYIETGVWASDGEGVAYCDPEICKNWAKLSSDGKKCEPRVNDPCSREELASLAPHATSGIYHYDEERGVESCTNVQCEDDYVRNADGTGCDLDCSNVTPRESRAGVKAKRLIDGQCYPSDCHGPRYILEGTEKSAQCVDQVGKNCDYPGTKAAGFEERVKSTKYVADGTDYGVKCVVTECEDPDFVPNDDGTDCEWGENTCSEQALGAIAFAKRGRWDAANNKCIVKSCKGSLKVDKENNKCGCGSLPDGVRTQSVPTDTSLEDPHCEPTACIGERWTLDGNGQSARCEEQECKIEHGQGKWVEVNDAYQCQVSNCNCGYVKSADSKSCTPKTDDQKKCTEATTPKLPKGAAAATMTCDGNREYCKISSCKEGYTHVEDQNKCVSNCKCGEVWDETKQKCRAWNASEKNCTVANAKSATRACDGETEYCKVSKCNDGYEISEDKKSCEAITGKDCKPKDKNARTGTRVYNQNTGKEWCKITACLGGYKVSDDGKKCEPTGKVKEAQEKYDLARGHEQALENKMLGGLSMGAIGMGGKMLAQGLAEQAADKAAEADMKAYLATFKCDYGAGRNIQGGKTNIELPGAAEMIPLYAEYVTLANDLKARKKQLGLKAGIESQKILDAATTGLYDDVGVGITSGAYASLARAMLNPDGEDAKMWADQQKNSKKLVTAGAVTAGLGVVGSIVGYVASNKSYQDKVKALESQKEKQLLENLKAELEALKLELANVNEMPDCPNGSSGAYPNCDCGDMAFNLNTNECYACDKGRTLQTRDGAKGCYCPSQHYWDDSEGKCVALPQGCTPRCNPDSPNVRVLIDCSCECGNGYDYDEATQTCKCEGENKREKDGVCETVTVVEEFIQGASIVNTITTSTQTDNVTLDSTALFQIGTFDLRDEAKIKLDEFLQEVTDSGLKNCKIEIVGYTDPVGGSDRNYDLSVQRANAVRDYLEGKNPDIVEIKAIGKGEANCTCGLDTEELQIPVGKENDPDYSVCKGKKPYLVVPDGNRYAPCRRIEMSMKCEKVTTEEQRESTSDT